MRATEVTIHNFRSIHEATIGLEEISLLAGANNAGKSNVIDAIRLFYSDSLKWNDDRDAPKVGTDDNESWVEIEYLPTVDELEQLKDEYKSENGTFRVRNYFRSGLGPDGKVRSGYYAYVDGKLSDTLFYGAKNVGSAKVGRLVYIPAVSKVDEHTKLTGPSSLRDLVATVMTKVVANSPAYSQLTDAFKAFEMDIKTVESEDGQSIQALETEITGELASWDSTFSLGIQSIQPDDILKSLIRPLLTDNTHGGDVDQLRFGAGFQRHLVYTLIKLAAKYGASKKVASAKKEFSPELTWILFEEPEAFLHPSQEDVLYESLLALVKDETTQVFLTTHSSRFVARSMDDLTRLIRVRRDDGVSRAFQLSRADLDAMFDAAHATDLEISPMPIDPAKANADALMGALKIELWLQPQRAAAFFAKRVILVEGPSELALYAYLTGRGGHMNAMPGVMVLDCMGKYNIHRFVALLSAFGVDHTVLYDGDGGGSRDAEVTAAIGAAESDYTFSVVRLDKDIESELGIMPIARNEKHRKPQYLLYHLESGAVSVDKIGTVVKLIEGLCESIPRSDEVVVAA